MLRPAARLKQPGLSLFFALLPLVPAVAAPSSLETINTDRYYVIQIAMQLLGTWALGNLIYSSFLLPKASRSRRYFYQMNLFWNVIIILIAAFGSYFALTAHPGLPLAESIAQQFNIEKILVLSIGLSVASIITGMLLRSKARNTKKPEKSWGYGRSVIIQSLFLLLFTIGLFMALSRFGSELIRAI